MFGHHDDQTQKQDQANPDESSDTAEEVDEVTTDQAADTIEPDEPTPAEPESTTSDWVHPGVPVDNEPQPISDVVSPAGGFPRSTDKQVTSHHGPASNDDSSDDEDSELVDIRQNALTELAPIVNELDQPPEEKFRTLMMVIQASDDQKLVKAAYEAAHGIQDEKVRAQALLDIVNEINYFTQPQDS